MAIRVALHHITKYTYDRPVTLAARRPAAPAPHCRTPILSYSLEVEPADALPQLAAGPVQQLPRPPRLPEAGAEARASRSISSPT